MNFLKWISTFFYPTHCAGCGMVVFTSNGWCQECRLSVLHPRMISGSRKAYLSGCYAIGDYRGGLRQAIIDLKFGKKIYQSQPLAKLLDDFPWWDRIPSDWVVVPIPISRERIRERGFDQTKEIYKVYMEEHNYLWCDALYKVRCTVPQSGLGRIQRKENIKGSFAIKGSKLIENRSILLVDDIYTTGTTMREAAKELHKAGANRIVGLVLGSGAS